MRKLTLLLIAGIALTTAVNAQQRISDGTVPAPINTNAVLDLQSSNKGLLFPRVSLSATTNAAPLSAHVKGMMVYNTAHIADVDSGLYYNDGTQWVRVKAGTDSVIAWQLKGNAGTNSGTNTTGAVTDGNYLGTADGQKLVLATNGIKRMIIDTANNAVGGTGSYIDVTAQWYGFPDANFVWGLMDTVSNDGGSVNGYHNVIFGFLNKSTAANSALFGSNNKDLNYSLDAGYNFIAGADNIILDPLGQTASANSVLGISNTLTAAGTNVVLGTANTVNSINASQIFNNIVAGVGNTVNADTAIAIGFNNTISHNRSLVIGNSATTTAQDQFSANFSNGYHLMGGGNTGIGTATPASTLQVNGSVALPVKVITASYTLTANDYTVIIRNPTGSASSANSVTITFPQASTCPGRVYVILNSTTTTSGGNTLLPQTFSSYDPAHAELKTSSGDGPNVATFSNVVYSTATGTPLVNNQRTTWQSDGVGTWYLIGN